MGRWARKPVNHTSWVALVTRTDRPKSVRNRCLIELFCGVVCVVTLPFWHFCWCRGFCHRTESDLFLFLFFKLLPGNPTYNLKDFSSSEILDNHKSVLTSFGIQITDEEFDFTYIYWIPKMHKNPYKHRFIAGSLKCSTKPLSILLTRLLTNNKQGLQKNCETAYSRSGVNQM